MHRDVPHVQIAEATGLDTYFCDLHSPWQRGSNENTNGLLRQYFPKGSDLSRWGPGYLDKVAAELNDRPRKRHHAQRVTPHQIDEEPAHRACWQQEPPEKPTLPAATR
ncbi:hypothetical protein GCM10011331_22460 [Flavimobilis marinus]|nr:hypothetical protein GCM10011331_22460 [Flavimobilis marinus]